MTEDLHDDAPEDIPVPGGEAPDKDARMWAMLCHLSGLAGYTCIPFANVIAPLIIWMMKRDTSPFVMDQGKEALNFQINMTILGIVVFILYFVVIGMFLAPVFAIIHLVFTILGGIKANDGITYRYPYIIRLIS